MTANPIHPGTVDRALQDALDYACALGRMAGGHAPDVVWNVTAPEAKNFKTMKRDLVRKTLVLFDATAGDVISIYGGLSATPSAGTITAESAEIVVVRVE